MNRTILSMVAAAAVSLAAPLALSQEKDEATLEKRLDVQLIDPRATARLVASGHLEWDGERLLTTPAGRLLLDHILGEIALR